MSARTILEITADLAKANAAVDAARLVAKMYAQELFAAQAREAIEAQLAALPPAAREAALAQMIKTRSAG